MKPAFLVWAASPWQQELMIYINAAVCAIALVIVICRTVPMHHNTTRLAIRVLYMLKGIAAVSSGGSVWLWNELPGPGQILASCVILAVLIVWRTNWSEGQPPAAKKGASPWSRFSWLPCCSARASSAGNTARPSQQSSSR